MKLFRNLMMTAFLLFGVSLSVTAQKNDDKRPPKNPPTIPVQPKQPPRDNPPRDDNRDNRPKKPEGYFADLDGDMTN